jgi:anhydro-N-acetylmuramic acid kinase
VVADFRSADLALGGQGAPLAPLYHREVFQGLAGSLAIVNIGGIANVTYLLEDGAVLGYDMGPGNCLIDAWAQTHLQQPYDSNGAWALTGEVDEGLLRQFLADPYFIKLPPKSLGKEYFSRTWLASYLGTSQLAADVQATLLALTAQSIANDLLSQPQPIERVLICGGGVHNLALMQALRTRLLGMAVDSTAVVGIDPDYLEAMMCAWLAAERLAGKVQDLRQVTGAATPHLVGVLYGLG